MGKGPFPCKLVVLFCATHWQIFRQVNLSEPNTNEREACLLIRARFLAGFSGMCQGLRYRVLQGSCSQLSVVRTFWCPWYLSHDFHFFVWYHIFKYLRSFHLKLYFSAQYLPLLPSGPFSLRCYTVTLHVLLSLSLC